MGRNKRNVKYGQKVSVYFDTDLDEVTEKWLKNLPNKSYAISEIVIKYAKGELIEKSKADMERQALLARIDDLKSMIDKLLPSANNTQPIHINPTSSITTTTNDEELAYSYLEKEEEIKTKQPSDDNIENIEIEKEKTVQEEQENQNNDIIQEENHSNNIGNINQDSDKSSKNIGIGNYKGGRGFRKKGKGLADFK